MKNSFFDISVITVVKNDCKNIEKTINSIVNQKTNNIEYIIIDGKSDDGTLEIISKYKDHINKIISEKDEGIYDAMNKGILKSNGNIICFCNSGDIIFPKGIETVIKKFKTENLDALFATVKRNYLGKTIVKSGVRLDRIKYNFDFATTHSTGFYATKNVYNDLGLYNTKFKLSSDYDFYYKLVNSSKNYNIGSTNKDKIIGEMTKGGYSSKFSFLDHLNEETRIRFNNKQNIFFIFLIYVNSIIKNLSKIYK